jgi:hypothetical protein
MQTMPGRPRGHKRLARALGLDSNPLRRASDRAEAWIRIGLVAVFLVAGPMAALGAGGWAYHAGITAARMQAASAHRVNTAAPRPVLAPSHLDRADQGSQASARSRWQGTAASARSGEVLAVVMTLAFTVLALLALLRLTRAFLTRRRLAAWEAAWSTVGPQWSGGRP